MSDAPAEPERRRSLAVRLAEVARYFGPFGFLAFGGPAANIVQLRRIFVVQQKWVDERTFVDLFALGNALPGPAFSQLAFAISLLRGGILPALLSFVLLTAPGAFAMLGIGFAVKSLPAALPPIVYALFSGLNSAAVGLIFHSGYTLASKVVTDPLTRLLVLGSGAVASCYESQWLYPVLMVAGGGSTFAFDASADVRARAQAKWDALRRKRRANREESSGAVELDVVRASEEREVEAAAPVRAEAGDGDIDDKDDAPRPIATGSTSPTVARDTAVPSLPVAVPVQQVEPEDELPPSLYFKLGIKGGLALCAAFVAFFIAFIVARATAPQKRALSWFVNMLMAGTFIFGGGPVVIPLARGYTVDPGWVSPRDFLIGLALVQALPGPVFNYMVYLGVLVLPAQPLFGAFLGLVGIFLPGLVLKVGTLPIYLKWRTNKITRSVLRGLNAAAVGLIFAAVFRLFRVGVLETSTVDPTGPAQVRSLDSDGFWVSVVGATFVAVESFNVPAPGAIVGGLLGGLAWYGVTSR